MASNTSETTPGPERLPGAGGMSRTEPIPGPVPRPGQGATPGVVATPGTSEDERTLGQLVADATQDVQTIVRGEIALAKAEVTLGMRVIGKGAGLLATAAFVALLGLIFLFHTVAYVLDIWLPLWAAYAITTLLLFLVAGLLGLLGRNALAKAQPKPERAIHQAQETIATLKNR
jgi:Putative Actinobacterial Holin-X, holin superfamily III